MAASKRSGAPARLWAPWRSGFLAAGAGRACFLCAAAKAPRARQRALLVVDQGASAVAVLNKYPYNNGHVLVAPRRHTGRFEALTAAEWDGIRALSQRLMRRLTRLLRPHGYNLGFNLGRPAGAGVPGHLHLHIVPRWNGDTNFMPVLDGTKVISQSLAELQRMLTGRR